MRFRTIALVFQLSILIQSLFGQAPRVTSGEIKHFENFKSKFVDAHTIDVWLPPGYSNKNAYTVLYMQDGQNLFDPKQNNYKQEWGLDETISALLKYGSLRKCIVVGIWNAGDKRHSEYLPQKPFETLTPLQQDSIYNTKHEAHVLFKEKIFSDNYLKFIVKELKPFIDSNFATLKDRGNTYIGGSSMGALISLYALCEYPNIFGGAACLSTHWPGIYTLNNNPIPDALIRYFKKQLPKSGNHKIYFDYGSKSLDTLYKPIQIKIDDIMKMKSYNLKSWITKEFPDADHTEKSWAKRVDIPIRFLLGT